MASTTYIVLLCILWCTFQVDGQKCVLSDDKRTVEWRLKEDLLCNYDKTERPVRNHKTTVNVTVTMTVKEISYMIDKTSQTPSFHVSCWQSMSWNDEYLKWNPGEYSNIAQIQIASSSIWLPELIPYNTAFTFERNGRFNSLCLLKMTGDVVCEPRKTHYVRCYPNLKAWPFDTQNCTLELGPWAQKGEETSFLLNETNNVNIGDYSPNLLWDLILVDAIREAAVTCCPNRTFPRLSYTFSVRRHYSHQIAIIIWPAIVMIVLTLTSILIDIDKIERMIMLSLNLICHFFEMQYLYKKIPASGENTPGVLLFFRDSMIITAFVLTFTVGLKCIAKIQSDSPEWVPGNFIMESMPGKILMFNEFDPTAEATINDDDDVGKPQAIRVKDIKKWRNRALFINRISFVVIVVIYVLLMIVLIP